MDDQQLKTDIEQKITSNKVMLFMKGTRTFPRCGFSGRVVEILTKLGAEFESMDILPDPRIRAILQERNQWPTIPQLHVGGKFVGGCDITQDLYTSGELEKLLTAAGAVPGKE